ncbi:MAG: S24 family peptidase [Gammaproteobacteria bacterium]|nr:S24 family peptidase [Gammaproteobacteria bacterium]
MLKSKIPPIEGSCSAKEPFGLMALGDSMLPEFKNGTVIVVDPEAVARDGSFVVVKIDEEYILRQLLIEADKLFVKALNESLKEEVIQLHSIEQIIGVVIQQGSRKKDLKKYR